jgi:hypothetical protein
MYKFLIAMFLILFVSIDSSTLSWNHDYRLEWSDFKGEPTKGTTTVAVTASGITFSFSIKTSNARLLNYNYIVKAHFYQEQSWYIKERATPNVLNHERLHFDITELFARKFRYRIENTNFTMDISNEMEAIHKGIQEELKDMQHRYDTETSNSQDIQIQKEWQTKVILQLNKLAYYSS